MSVAGDGVGAVAVEEEDGGDGIGAAELEEPELGEAGSGNMRDAPKNFLSCGAGLHGFSVISGPGLKVVAAES
jgi:hypothetical protein